MIPVGVGVVFLAYTTGIWGYCLVRGYNVQFRQLFGAAWPGAAKTTSTSAASSPVTGQTAAQQQAEAQRIAGLNLPPTTSRF